jgi:hypothetical protein
LKGRVNTIRQLYPIRPVTFSLSLISFSVQFRLK